MTAQRHNRPIALLETMRLIRAVEQRLSQLFADGEVPGFIHLSIGQEAIPTGVCAALTPQGGGQPRQAWRRIWRQI